MAAWQALLGPLAISGLSFASFALLHLLVWRSRLRRGLAYGWMFRLLGLGAVLGPVIWQLSGAGPWVSHAAPALAVYLLLAMLYLHFYSGLVRSLSVRILGELAEDSRSGLDAAELDRRYPLGEILDRRLEALVDTDWITRDPEGGYHNRRRGRRWARGLTFLARLYRQEVTG